VQKPHRARCRLWAFRRMPQVGQAPPRRCTVPRSMAPHFRQRLHDGVRAQKKDGALPYNQRPRFGHQHYISSARKNPRQVELRVQKREHHSTQPLHPSQIRPAAMMAALSIDPGPRRFKADVSVGDYECPPIITETPVREVLRVGQRRQGGRQSNPDMARPAGAYQHTHRPTLRPSAASPPDSLDRTGRVGGGVPRGKKIQAAETRPFSGHTAAGTKKHKREPPGLTMTVAGAIPICRKRLRANSTVIERAGHYLPEGLAATRAL